MSKGLEALKELKVWATNGYFACKPSECDELAEPIEKELKALEIIKNKGVDILALQYYENSSQYNFSLRGKFSQLTEDEFDLLKEVLNNG